MRSLYHVGSRGRAIFLFCAAVIAAGHAQTYKVLNSNLGYPWPFIQGTDGNLYGTTAGGGEITKLTLAGILTTVAGIDYGTVAPLVQASDGNFYGTIYTTPDSDNGAVFQLTPAGVVTTLHTFNWSDGALPRAALVQGTDGALYSTTDEGGQYGNGVFFKITTTGVYTKLYDFGNLSAEPLGVIQGADGNFYGTTYFSAGYGTVFKITPAGALTTLHNFSGGTADGARPAVLVQAVNGKLYGTTSGGGANNLGTIFEITTAGVLTTLHSFSFSDGYNYYASQMIQATNGNLYGALSAGGATACGEGVGYGCGTIFEITPSGTFSVVHTFTGPYGATPNGLFQDTNGTLYGTTYYGGPSNYGVFFSLSLGLGAFVNTIPTSGAVGTPITIFGTNLTGATSVSFNGTPAAYTVVSGTVIATTVPAGATTGKIEVVTPSATLYTNLAPFRVTPSITSFTPTSGSPGTVLVITGNGFLKASRVTFYKNILASSFTVDSDTQITVTVPAGAMTGPLQVTTPGGTVTSAGTFTVN